MINITDIKDSQKSETLLINEASKLKEMAGETIFKFGFGQSPFLPPQYVIDTLAEFSPRKEYVAVQGIQELREVVAAFHQHHDGIQTTADNVLIGPGSKMLIYAVLAAFNRADVYLITPSWVSYEPQAKLAKLDVNRIHTSFQDRWRLTPELMEEACQSRDVSKPGILILNYPGNPDGLSYTQEELTALAAVFRKYNILVISDEIYGLLNHTGEHKSLACVYPEGTIVTTGLSKWCGAGGWRLGVALLPNTIEKKFKETLIGIASETYSCAATPVQYAAIQAYQKDIRVNQYLHQQRRILKLAGNHIYQALKQAGVNVHAPQGGFYLNPDFSPLKEKLKSRGITSSELLCEVLLKETGVAILPGNAFGYEAGHLIARLAYVDFDGIKALAAAEEEKEALSDAFLAEQCPKIVEGTRRLVEWLA